MKIRLNKYTINKAKKLGLTFSPSCTNSYYSKKSSIKVETPTRIYGNFGKNNLFVGAFTYSFSDIDHAKIGRYCSIAEDVSIGGTFSHPKNWLSTSPFQYSSPENDDFWGEKCFSQKDNFTKEGITIIGNDVWIGQGAKIKCGIKIGDGAIIGFGSILTKDVEPYSIVAGNPGKIIGYRFEKDIIEKLLKLKWWDYHFRDFVGVNFSDIEKAIDKIQELVETGKIQKYQGKILSDFSCLKYKNKFKTILEKLCRK